jgi:hypothetical protein
MATIINLISNLQSNLDKPLVSTALTPAEIAYVKTLLQAETNVSGNSGIIYKIKSEFNNIIKEDVIILQDIPNLVLIVTNLLKTNIIQNSVKNVGIINVIQFVLDSLFDPNILLINKTEAKIINVLVDSSLQLIKTNIDFVVKEEQIICDFFKGCNCSNLENECYQFLEYYSL